MLDRVREATFSILGRRVAGARVLDLYAGSGSLGLEALSRGAALARMIERDPKAVAVLRENVEALGLRDRAQVVRGDALREDLWRPLLTEDAYDVVFLDPPYRDVEEPAARAIVLARATDLLRRAIRPGGILVLHVPSRALESLRFDGTPASSGEFVRDERRYGSSGVLLVRREEGSSA